MHCKLLARPNMKHSIFDGNRSLPQCDSDVGIALTRGTSAVLYIVCEWLMCILYFANSRATKENTVLIRKRVCFHVLAEPFCPSRVPSFGINATTSQTEIPFKEANIDGNLGVFSHGIACSEMSLDGWDNILLIGPYNCSYPRGPF